MLTWAPAEALMPTELTGNGRRCVVCNETRRAAFLERAGYRICRCESCGLRFLDPQPSLEEVQAFYNREYFGSGNSERRGYDAYVADAENHRASFRNRLRRMPVPKPGDRLLDVGAAAGYFVEQASRAAWIAEGIEPSEWAARYASQVLHQPVRLGALEDAHYETGAFAAVTMWEVIEHVPNPRAFLSEAARLLRPGGHLVLSTPDSGSMVTKVFGKRWLGWSKVPEHLYFFDRQNLFRLLRETGFRVSRWSYVSITVNAAFAGRRLGTLLGLPILGRLPSRLGRLSLPVNPLYDLMVVAERRSD
jgi:2-polyprenyl-3-methyl-5-hydroxy-6-metoxy-1,4-benzoquinol methylase